VTYVNFFRESEYENSEDAYTCFHLDKNPAYVFIDDNNEFGIKPGNSWLQQFTEIKRLDNGILYERTASSCKVSGQGAE
jgi:hypothetical protein